MAEPKNANYLQILDLLKKINQNDLVKLTNYLNEITLSEWLYSFRKKMQKSPISEEEILSLAKETRGDIYANSH